MEDRFDEFDSEVRQRPRRRRRRINMADFFKAAGSGWGEAPGARGEITNPTDAYAALDVEYGSSLLVVTRAFRDRAKKLHPTRAGATEARNRNSAGLSKRTNF